MSESPARVQLLETWLSLAFSPDVGKEFPQNQMSFEPTLFGGVEWKGTDKSEVQGILEKYPAAAKDRGLLLWLIARDRMPWLEHVPDDHKRELKAFLRDFESIRRRTQEACAELNLR